jgi:hypothetical protein
MGKGVNGLSKARLRKLFIAFETNLVEIKPRRRTHQPEYPNDIFDALAHGSS